MATPDSPGRSLFKRYLVVAVVFGLMAAAVLAEQMRLLAQHEKLAPPLHRPLAQAVPESLGLWQSIQDNRLTAGETTILEPEDYILRHYRNLSTGQTLSLFVPFSRKAETAVGHEPHVCYGGAGFTLVDQRSQAVVYLAAGESRRVDMQILTFSRQDRRQRVLFGYLLSSGQSTTNPLVVRLERAVQKLTGRRTASLMKIQLQLEPVPGRTLDQATEEALQFVAELMPHLAAALPEAE